MSESSTNSFSTADEAARQQSSLESVDSTSPPCPSIQKSLLKILVVGEDDKGIGQIALTLRNGEDQDLKGKTDSNGEYIFKGLEDEPHTLCLSELDKDAWEILNEVSLEGQRGKCQGEAQWQTKTEAAEEPGSTHKVGQGECIAKLGDQYGFFPDTIWDHEKNMALKDLRQDMHILATDDEVFIPSKERIFRSVQAESEVKIKRKAVPEMLKIRFLDDTEQPRAGVPYLVDIKTKNDELVANKQGETDVEGFLVETIPPDAITAEITLRYGSNEEKYQFNLGQVDPIDSNSGVQARLKNLGYDCGSEDGELGEKTRRALKAFQTAKELEITGDIDEKTVDSLRALFLS